MNKLTLYCFLAEIRHDLSGVVTALGVLKDSTQSLSITEAQKVLSLAHSKLGGVVESLDKTREKIAKKNGAKK